MADNEQASSEPKSSESTTGIVLALIFFFPLGLYWMWKYPDWPVGRKWAISGGVAALLLIGLLADDEKQTDQQVSDASNAVAEKTVADESKRVTQEPTAVQNGISHSEKGDGDPSVAFNELDFDSV